MTNLLQELKSLGAKSQTYLNDWLTGGLIKYYTGKKRFSFSPHDFITIDDSPVDGLTASYNSAPLPIKRKIRKATVAATSILTNPAIENGFDLDNRLEIASVLAVLSEHFLCFEAGRSFTQSALDFKDIWLSSADEIYALALKVNTGLATKGKMSVDFDVSKANLIESQIIRLVTSSDFKNCYAPLCLRALVELNPESFFTRHRKMMGNLIRLHHAQSPDDAKHAFITASFIINNAFSQLQRFADDLIVHTGENTDGWIFDALMLPESPFSIFRIGSDPSIIYFARKTPNNTNKYSGVPRIFLKSNSLIYLKTLGADLQTVLNIESREESPEITYLIKSFEKSKIGLLRAPHSLQEGIT